MAPAFVAVADSVFPSLDPARAVLATIGADMELAAQPTPEAILKIAAGADALLVTYAKITADMIATDDERCRIISRFGIGVDNVDLARPRPAGHRRHEGARLLHRRSLRSCDGAAAVAGPQDPVVERAGARGPMGDEGGRADSSVARRVLGLVGFGRIPQLVAPKAQAFGLRVIASDPFASAEVFAREGVERVEFADLLAQSDYVSIHTPLLPETRNLFSTDAFRQMKPTAYLINTARGPIVDEVALAQALDARQLAGAALDVMPQRTAGRLAAPRPR